MLCQIAAARQIYFRIAKPNEKVANHGENPGAHVDTRSTEKLSKTSTIINNFTIRYSGSRLSCKTQTPFSLSACSRRSPLRPRSVGPRRSGAAPALQTANEWPVSIGEVEPGDQQRSARTSPSPVNELPKREREKGGSGLLLHCWLYLRTVTGG